MAWFTPTNLAHHPCRLPTQKECDDHRHGEWFRCEVCTALWRMRLYDRDLDYGLDPQMKWVFDLKRGWFIRWRYRKEGYTNEHANGAGLPAD